MKISITLKSSDDVEKLNNLIETIRKRLGEQQVSVFEAPDSLDYPYPFPIVTVDKDESQKRRFGGDAIDFLTSLSTGSH